ncbi:MAG: hypothetical protein II038_15590 [Lachnospiraceae bacterium]|nr:hypothetical protein [Lachnospiraceae bacterium]
MNAVIIEYPDSLPEVFDDQVFYLYIKKTDGVDPGLYQVCGAHCRERKHKLYPDMLIDTGLEEVFLTYESADINADCKAIGSCDLVEDEAATEAFEKLYDRIAPHMFMFLLAGSEADVLTARTDIFKKVKAFWEMLQGAEICIDAAYEGKLSEDMHCSEAMKNILHEFLVYDTLADAGLNSKVDKMYAAGLLPAADKRKGKAALDELGKYIRG